MDARIGANVARLRGGKSQRDTAAAMRELGWKWSHVTLVAIESGERPLRLAEARDLASVIGTDVRLLLEPVGKLAWNEAYVDLDRSRRRMVDAVETYIQDLADAALKVSEVDLTDEQEETIRSMLARGPVQIAAEVVGREGSVTMMKILEGDIAGRAPLSSAQFARMRELLRDAFASWHDEAEYALDPMGHVDGEH